MKGKFKVQLTTTAKREENGGCVSEGSWAAKPLTLEVAVPVTATCWPKAEEAVSAKVLGRESLWFVQGELRRPVWQEHRGQKGAWGLCSERRLETGSRGALLATARTQISF